MADSLCPVCLARFESPRLRTAHLAADHDGTRLTWAGRVATIHHPDGTTRTLTMRDFRELRRAGSTTEPAAPAAQPQATAGALPSEPAAPSEPATSEPAPPRTPRVGRQVPRDPASDPVARGISRATVEEAFSQAFLADLLRQASEIISEWDGAGERGMFSRTEAATVAALLYDQAVDIVVRRFAGNVNRVKAAVAVIIIMAGKGRVHAAAISARQARVRAGLPPIDPAPAGAPAGAPAPVVAILPWPIDGQSASDAPLGPPRPSAVAAQPVPVAPAGAGDGWQPMTVAEIARRQRAWAADQSAAALDDPTARMLRESGTARSALDEVFGGE